MTVHLYRSTQKDAPVLAGQAGSLIALLKACLVNGYGSTSVASITRNATVATVECLDHGFSEGDVAVIAGADQSGFNGTVVVATVPNTHSFTYAVVDTLPAAATGVAITAKRAPAGWINIANSTNREYFRIAGGAYMDVDDSGVSTGLYTVADVKGWRELGTQYGSYMDFPRTTKVGFIKSATEDATAREWVIVASDTMLYFWVNYNSDANGLGGKLHTFGYTKGDALVTPSTGLHPCIIAGNAWNGVAFLPNDATYNYSGDLYENIYQTLGEGKHLDVVVALNTMTVATGKCGLISDWSKTNNQRSLGFPSGGYPQEPVTGNWMKQRLAPVFVYDINDTGVWTNIRGVLPGFWNPITNIDITNGSVFGESIGGVPTVPARRFIFLRLSPSSNEPTRVGGVVLEYSDTWPTV